VKYRSDVGAKQDELAAIQAETQLVQAQIAELSPYAVIQDQRVAMTETAKGIYASSVPFSILLQELSLVIPENVRLQNLTATVPPAMLPGAAAVEAAPAAGASVDVTFTGQTEDHRDVAEFMTRLGLIPQLMGITLTSSTEAASTTSTTTASTAPAATYTTFTVTAQQRPYTQLPPSTTLNAEVVQ
ncbi:MAG: PilN domain-containing protein, partial [Thermoleophilia bacterium]|nr:PilN domain-containing protein [Thermoleophilia bacterium]